MVHLSKVLMASLAAAVLLVVLINVAAEASDDSRSDFKTLERLNERHSARSKKSSSKKTTSSSSSPLPSPSPSASPSDDSGKGNDRDSQLMTLSKRELVNRMQFFDGVFKCLGQVFSNVIRGKFMLPLACCQLPFVNLLCKKKNPVPKSARPCGPATQNVPWVDTSSKSSYKSTTVNYRETS